MAVELTIVIRFEHPPSHTLLANLIEDAFDDAIVLETEEEEI